MTGRSVDAGDGPISIPAALAGERLDRVVSLLTGRARADAGRLVDSGGVSIAGVPVTHRSHRLREGDRLVFSIEPLAPPVRRLEPSRPGDVSFEVLYEDEDLIVVNKPVGVVTHPGAGTHSGTLAGGLLARYPELARLPEQGYGSPERPGIVHRLDKDTSGLLMVARSPRGFTSLTAQLATRTAKRTYAALVLGTVSAAQGIVDAPIGRSTRHPTRMAVSGTGRDARTSYRVLRRFTLPIAATELELQLDTGRTHQIRVHLAAIGHPVVGDARYGGARGSSGVRRMMLHAVKLGVLSPATGELLQFEAEPPSDYLAALQRFS